MKIKNEKLKFALIGASVLVAVTTPVIIIGSIYINNSINTSSPLLSDLNIFYNSEEAILFNKLNFIISAPIPVDGKYFVKNIKPENVIFQKTEELKNFSYEIKNIRINPNENNASFTFNYTVNSILDPSVKIEKTSQEYFEFTNDLGTHSFSK